MPQMLHLQSSDELPFFVRNNQGVVPAFCARKRCRVSARFFMLFVVAFVVFGFLYIQFYDFPRQLSNASSRNLVLRGQENMTVKGEQPNNEIEGLAQPNKVIAAPNLPQFTGPTNDRQKAVRNAFKHAWKGYKKYAWGHDTLRPISMKFTEWMECGLTIIDGLDTAIIMGLNEEYLEAKKWIEEDLEFDKNRLVNLFETTIRILGGLLTAFHLTGEPVFLNKSADIGSRLIGALNSPSPIPYSDVNLQTKSGVQPSWGGDSSLSEVTSIQLEFRDLSRLLGNDVYEKAAFRISEHVHSIGCEKHNGLCGMFLSPNTGKFTAQTTITFGARSDSYYEYLLKQWLQTGKTISWLADDYKRAVDSMTKQLWRYSEPNKFGFIGELLGGETFSPKMDHLVCFMAGTLALGTQHGMPQSHMDLAKNLSRTCFEMYRTVTGLGPEIAYFNMLPGVKYDLNIKLLDAHSLLRPEAFEAWFYMYRITGDKQYQEWGWMAFQAIEKYAKVENGYSSVNNAKKIPVSYRDMMESFYLAETLKYLYLLFADDQTILPFHKYVFNTEGHPLPIYEN